MLVKLLLSIKTNEESWVAIPVVMPLVNVLSVTVMFEEPAILTPVSSCSKFKRVMVTLFRPATITPLFPSS